ncbi:hypothetical protein HMPREF9098_0531 [Kingella denitrificans ATCC 33394]|uniref:Uncharacterized protein n=1 Tax=Kingella denitrificans ATCC 33394 TaxID=888741 RepID=F0EXE7_9NEIS|nr:hypothetical protein HMPREF9098_0531 [Kingella denitrificans ATCC 33394]
MVVIIIIVIMAGTMAAARRAVAIVAVARAAHRKHAAGGCLHAHFVFAAAVVHIHVVIRAVTAAVFQIDIIDFTAAHFGLGNGRRALPANVAALRMGRHYGHRQRQNQRCNNAFSHGLTPCLCWKGNGDCSFAPHQKPLILCKQA